MHSTFIHFLLFFKLSICSLVFDKQFSGYSYPDFVLLPEISQFEHKDFGLYGCYFNPDFCSSFEVCLTDGLLGQCSTNTESSFRFDLTSAQYDRLWDLLAELESLELSWRSVVVQESLSQFLEPLKIPISFDDSKRIISPEYAETLFEKLPTDLWSMSEDSNGENYPYLDDDFEDERIKEEKRMELPLYTFDENPVVFEEDKPVTNPPQEPVEKDILNVKGKLSLSGVDPNIAFVRTTKDLSLYQIYSLLDYLENITGPHSLRNLSNIGNKIAFSVVPVNGYNATFVAHLLASNRQHFKKWLNIDIRETGIGSMDNERIIESAAAHSQDGILTLTLALVGCVTGMLFGVLAVLVVKKSRDTNERMKPFKQAKEGGGGEEYQELCRSHMAKQTSDKPLVDRVMSLSSEVSDRSSTSSWTEDTVTANMDINSAHLVLTYMEEHLYNREKLDEEWEELLKYTPDVDTSIDVAKQNADKNRYENRGLPFDCNRIRLRNPAYSEYINASPIMDTNPKKPVYILAPVPLEHTFPDFWQMIWEQSAAVVVMLIGTNEMRQYKEFWPLEGVDTYGNIEVHLVSEHIWCDDFLVRSFYTKNLSTNETRTITHFNFLTWKTDTVPETARALLELRRKVNKSYKGKSSPIVVLCDDGINRSGCYILIDMVLSKMYRGAKEIDMAATLEHLRDQRPNVLSTKLLFEFSLTAVAEEVNALLKTLPQ